MTERIYYASYITTDILSHDMKTSNCKLGLFIYESNYLEIAISFKVFKSILNQLEYFRLDEKP